jgi:hypothetical protein
MKAEPAAMETIRRSLEFTLWDDQSSVSGISSSIIFLISGQRRGMSFPIRQCWFEVCVIKVIEIRLLTKLWRQVCADGMRNNGLIGIEFGVFCFEILIVDVRPFDLGIEMKPFTIFTGVTMSKT